MERIIEVAKSVISFYNCGAGSNLSPYSKDRQEKVFEALEKVNGSAQKLKAHITKWLEDNKNTPFDSESTKFKACLAEFEPALEDIAVAQALTPSAPDNNGLTESMAIIGKAIAEVVKSTSITKIEGDIMQNVQATVEKFIMDTYGPIERKIDLIINGDTREMKGTLHDKFDIVLKFVANNLPVYLVGPAGSGKNVLCKQVADALGLKFYFTNAVTQEYKLTGFTDAMGNYQPTQFYKAFTEGGLFMLDEIDASIPEVLNILNAAIANKYFDFPAPIGYKEAHPDFRVVAAGNTSGHGADYQYVGRNQLDGASINRFALVKVDYSKTIEDSLAGDVKLADFCREFRAAAKRVGVNIIVSYRAIESLARMLPLLSMEEALETCLLKDLEKDDLNLIVRELHDTPYKTALNNVYSKM